MEMFLFKCLITLSVFYNVIAVANETSEGDTSTKVNTQKLNSNARSKRQRNLGYYDYLHYLLDKHAHSADEHLAAHKPIGPYRPYEMHVFPHGLTRSSGEISHHYVDSRQQGVNVFPKFGQKPNAFAGSGRGQDCFPGFTIHRGVNTPSRPIVERTGRRMTYSSGTQASKHSCGSNRGRTITKPQLRYKSQERNRGTIDRNCTFTYRKSTKTEARKELRASHENVAQQLRSHAANLNSPQNVDHIVVLHLGANNCSCSKYAIKSTEGIPADSSGHIRDSQAEPNPAVKVSNRSWAATDSSQSDSAEISDTDVGAVSASIPTPSSSATTNNSSFGTTVPVPASVPAADHGFVFTPTTGRVTDSSSTLATNSGSSDTTKNSSFGTTVPVPASVPAADHGSVFTATAGHVTDSASMLATKSVSHATTNTSSFDTSVPVSVAAADHGSVFTPTPDRVTDSASTLATNSGSSDTTNNSSFGTTVRVPAFVPAVDHGSVFTSTPGRVTESASTLATNSGSNATTNISSFASTVPVSIAAADHDVVFTSTPGRVTESASTMATNSGSAFGATSVLRSSSESGFTSAADPRTSVTSTFASLDTFSVSATTFRPNSALAADSATAFAFDSASATQPGSAATSSPASTLNPRLASTFSPNAMPSPTTVSNPNALPSSVPRFVLATNPTSTSTSSTISSDFHSPISANEPDSKHNTDATTTITPIPSSTSMPASSEVPRTISVSLQSSKTASASATGLGSDAASGSISTSTLNSSNAASSVSSQVLSTASEFKSISNSEFTSRSDTSVLSDDSQQSPAFGTVTAPSSTHHPAMARQTLSQDDFEPIPIPMDDLSSTFVLSAAHEPTTAVNQSNIESGNMDLMSFLDNLERIDHISQPREDSSRTSTTNSSTQSQHSTLLHTRNHSNISRTQTHASSNNWHNRTSNQRKVVQHKTDTISGNSDESEFIEHQGDDIVAIAGTSMDLNVTHSRDGQHIGHKIEDIEQQQTQARNDDLSNDSERSDEIFFDDISEAEILRANNPSSMFEAAQHGDGISTFFAENLSSSSFHHNSAVNETETTEDVSNIPIRSNGKFKSLQFGSGSARTLAETAENNQDTLELETGNSRGRLNDMTGTGSRFVNILRSPNERASEATFAEPLVSGVYSTKRHEFKYKSRSPPSIYWHRIEPKPYTSNRYLKELRPFESADFEDVHFSQDCLGSEEFVEEPRTAELTPRFSDLCNCKTHLT